MRRLGLLAVAAVLAASCGGSDDTLVVSAASSLTDAFADVEAAFEATHPDVDVRLNLAGSAALREQILEGADVDVFASADQATMRAVVEALGVEARVFARNEIQLAVPNDNPGSVAGLEALADPALFIGLCAREVPCGAAGRRVLRAAGVEPAVDTFEASARALAVKLEARELDAALIYRTDVLASDALEGLDLDLGPSGVTTYLIAALGDPVPPAASAFVAFVASTEGREILTRHGFGAP